MDELFGVSAKALALSEDRASLITNNLVNSSTPNYKARDFDFGKEMQKAGQAMSGMQTTHSNHIHSSSQTATAADIKYRIPMQNSMDGNTVDPEIERKNFLQNSIKYQVSLSFVQSKGDQLMKAIKGE